VPGADDRDGRRLIAAEITRLTDDELVAAIHDSEELRRVGRERTGRLLAELHRRGRLSWPAIARRTGIRQTTAYELAEPYLIAEDGPEQPPK
jgi:hypothetical protein